MGLLSPEVQALYETDPAVKAYLDAMAAQAPQVGPQPQLQSQSPFGLPADIQPLYDSNPDVRAYWDAMAQNPEFARSQGISAAYQDILGRAPDATGLDYWSNSGASLADVIAGIYNSPENRYQDIAQLGYRNILGRDPDQPGLDYWVGTNLGIPDVIAAIANSEEARLRSGTSGAGGGSTGNAPVYGDATTGNVINGINRGAPVGVGNVPNIPLPKNLPTAALGPANDAAHMLALGQQPAFSAAAMRGISPLMQRYLSPVQSSYWQLASQFAQAPYAGKPWGDMPWGQMPVNNTTGQLNYAPQGTGNTFNQAMNVVGPMLPTSPQMNAPTSWQSMFPGWAQSANLGLGS